MARPQCQRNPKYPGLEHRRELLIFSGGLIAFSDAVVDMLMLKDNCQIHGLFWSLPNLHRRENFDLGQQVITRLILNSFIEKTTAAA